MKKEKKSFVARWWWVFLLVGMLVGPMLGFAGAVILTRVMPKQYESTAVVQVSPSGSGFSRGGLLESRQYFSTQFEVIVGAKTLAPVVEEMDLVNRWGRSQEEVMGVLKESIEVRQLRGTDLIEIKARSFDAGLSQKIASAVALSYQDRRNVEEVARAEVQIKALDAEIEEQKKRVEKKRKVLDEIVGITGKPYFEGKRSEPSADDEVSEDLNEGGLAVEEVAEYQETTNEYQSALELLQELKLEHSSERVGLRSPREAIRIQEDPKVARVPVSPNVPMNLMLGVVGGGLGGVLMAVVLLFFLGTLSNGQRRRAEEGKVS